MATFLLDRAQRVKIGNEYSHSGHPNGGIPQAHYLDLNVSLFAQMI
ncbi:hypothetical protein NP493_228g04016 [Ridgeia piscesae]|uniref:Uncharacterized protein n=1 Tax=Ridgeia piscesae TaxID=27915 RepID=A0AAD9NZW8_RIDPI|nr:hypothetical protein NP493_228g04016 [Ridgeia piscesae]